MTNGFVAGIAHLARHPSLSRRDLSSMRRGNLYPIMAPDVRPADPELRHTMLGMTEAGSVITDQRGRIRSTRTPARFVRQAGAGLRNRTVDRAVGELCIRGPYVMQRYYKRSREECFDADGWFHTGDLVRTDADGFVYFIGRRGAMIKTAGANVAPAEVETAIAKVAGGTVAHVLGLPDRRAGTAGRRGRRGRGRRRVRRGRPARSTRGGAVRLQDSETVRRRARVPRYRCSPAARSTCTALQKMFDAVTPSTNWSGFAHNSTVTSRWSSTPRPGSATPSSTTPPAPWRPHSSEPASARAPGSV